MTIMLMQRLRRCNDRLRIRIVPAFRRAQPWILTTPLPAGLTALIETSRSISNAQPLRLGHATRIAGAPALLDPARTIRYPPSSRLRTPLLHSATSLIIPSRPITFKFVWRRKDPDDEDDDDEVPEEHVFDDNNETQPTSPSDFLVRMKLKKEHYAIHPLYNPSHPKEEWKRRIPGNTNAPKTPRIDRSKDAKSFVPIFIKSLIPNNHNLGRVLKGKIVAEPFFKDGYVHAMIEDDLRDFVKVRFPPPSISYFKHRPAEFNIDTSFVLCDVYPLNSRISIVDPYFEEFSDGFDRGFWGVKVESPDQVVQTNETEKSVATWQKEGNVHFKGGRYKDAVDCFTMGIQTMDGSEKPAADDAVVAVGVGGGGSNDKSLSFSPSISTMLVNLAFAYYKMKDYQSAVIFAIAAYDSLKNPHCAEVLIAASMNEYFSKIDLPGIQRQDYIYFLLPEANWWNPIMARLFTQILWSWNLDQLTPTFSETGNTPLISDVDELKRFGYQMVIAQNYTDSIPYFLKALSSEKSLSTLFSNKSLAFIKLNDFNRAFVYSTVAAALDPYSSKAHYRRAYSLLKIKPSRAMEARHCCLEGLKLLPDDADLHALLSEIDNASSNPRKNSKNTLKHLYFTAGLLFTGKIQAEELIKSSKIPPFHLEYLRSATSSSSPWASGCNPKEVLEYVALSYIVSQYKFLEKEIREITGRNEKKELEVRVGDSRNMSWYNAAIVGELNPEPKRSPVDQTVNVMCYPFAEGPALKAVLECGETHVSVGCKDLMCLLQADLRALELSVQLGPLRWHGFESNSISVAKSLVLAELMKRNLDSRLILQVWFSAGWAEETEKVFKDVVRVLLGRKVEAPVKAVLEHWSTASVSLTAARERWRQAHSKAEGTFIPNLKSEDDRATFTTYLLTGQLLDAQVGNITMFTSPNPKTKLSFNENFLQCIPLPTLVEYRKETSSFVEAGIAYLLERIEHISKHVSEGSIQIHLYNKNQLTHPKTLAEIQALQPSAISWSSSIVDHQTPSDFFSLARKASEGLTCVHYAQTVDWVKDVKGTHLIDYDQESHPQVISHCETAIEHQYLNTGMKPFFRTPSLMRPESVVLSVKAREYQSEWFRVFMEKAGFKDIWSQAKMGADVQELNMFSRHQGRVGVVFYF
ncbi:hypothetical protein HDV05_005886 [Chytridiales sp. JEL 0842]|nr:hypothetical protein HDV05_005886 [Chytridiales sp. JEL 0842]